MPRDIDVGLLRAFTAVIETGSVTGAARLLNRTQAAVSLQIKRLEDQLGVELFLREHRRLRLTKSGERMLAGALRLLADWGSARGGAGEPLRHEVCGTPLQARWHCPTCERLVEDDEPDELTRL